MDCRSTELGCLFQKVIKQSIKSLQQSLNVFFLFCFVFYQLKRLFWTGKTDNCFSLCQWKIFILFFYCQVVLGKKKSVSVFYLDHFNFSLTPCRAKHVIFSYHPHIVLTRVADRRFSCLQTAGWWSWLILNVNIGNLTAHLSGLSSGKGTKNSLLYTWGNSKQSLKELL